MFKILVVEDDQELNRTVCAFLNQCGYEALGCPDAMYHNVQDDFAVIQVSDTGCGICKEAGAHIFEKFYQEDTSHSAQGNGLGLALVKKVVDIMDGEIYAESKAGQGSTFTVKLRRMIDEPS